MACIAAVFVVDIVHIEAAACIASVVAYIELAAAHIEVEVQTVAVVVAVAEVAVDRRAVVEQLGLVLELLKTTP